MVYKWCVVPQCKSTTIHDPGKLFVSVPTNPKKRNKWLLLARRDPKSIVSHSNVFMCEDHFNMEIDVANYLKYKMGFSKNLLLASEAMPSKFHCQQDYKRRLGAVCSRAVFSKRKRKAVVHECIKEYDSIKETATSAKQKPSVGRVSSSRAGPPFTADTESEEKSTKGLNGPPPSEYVCHHTNDDTRCSLCRDLIKSLRTLCLQCPTYLCITCSAASPHNYHYMLRVPAGRDQEEVTVLLNKLRDLITTLPESQGTEDTEPTLTDIIMEQGPYTDTSASMEAGVQLIECKQEAPDEGEDALQSGHDEPELHVSYTASDGPDPIGIDIKPEVQDDFEDITLNFNPVHFSDLTNRKLIDDPLTPCHSQTHQASQAKHLRNEIQPPDQIVPGSNSNILDTCDVEHKSSNKRKIGTKDGHGKTGGKSVQKKNVKPISDKSARHKTVGSSLEMTRQYTSIQEATKLLLSELNLSSVKIKKYTDDVESMWSGGELLRGHGGRGHITRTRSGR